MQWYFLPSSSLNFSIFGTKRVAALHEWHIFKTRSDPPINTVMFTDYLSCSCYLWWQRVAIHFALYIHISYWYCLGSTTAIVQYTQLTILYTDHVTCIMCDQGWTGYVVCYHLSDLIHPIRSQEMNIIVIVVPDTSQSSLSYYWFIGSTPFIHWLHPFRSLAPPLSKPHVIAHHQPYCTALHWGATQCSG